MCAAILSFLLPETFNKCLPDELPAVLWPCLSGPDKEHVEEVQKIEDESEKNDSNQFDNSHFCHEQFKAESTNL